MSESAPPWFLPTGKHRAAVTRSAEVATSAATSHTPADPASALVFVAGALQDREGHAR